MTPRSSANCSGACSRARPISRFEFARDGLEALQQLEEFRPTVITLDVHMPRMGGLECLDRIMVERPCPVVMVSSLTADGAEATLEALHLGAVDFVLKPEGAVSLRIDELAPTLVEKIRAAATAKMKNSARLRERLQQRARGRPAPLPAASVAGVTRRAYRATVWCSSAPRPAVRRRSKPCWRRYPRISRGRFSSRNTCRQPSRGRSPNDSTICAPSASSRCYARWSWNPAASTSVAAMRISSWPARSRGARRDERARARPTIPGIRARTGS